MHSTSPVGLSIAQQRWEDLFVRSVCRFGACLGDSMHEQKQLQCDQTNHKSVQTVRERGICEVFVSSQAISLATAITLRYCEGRSILPGITNGSLAGYIAVFAHSQALITRLESVICPISVHSLRMTLSRLQLAFPLDLHATLDGCIRCDGESSTINLSKLQPR